MWYFRCSSEDALIPLWWNGFGPYRFVNFFGSSPGCFQIIIHCQRWLLITSMLAMWFQKWEYSRILKYSFADACSVQYSKLSAVLTLMVTDLPVSRLYGRTQQLTSLVLFPPEVCEHLNRADCSKQQGKAVNLISDLKDSTNVRYCLSLVWKEKGIW